MDPIRIASMALRVEHKHTDGSWGRLEPRPAHHDPAAHDPERHWDKAQLYVCTTCDEQVSIGPLDQPGAHEPG
jgi:hypothetical protein